MRSILLAPVALIALASVAPRAVVAQGLRVTVEPRAGALPAASLWGRTSVSHTDVLQPSEPGMPTRVVSSRSTSVRRDALPLLGASVAVAPAGGRWRVVVEGATARGDLRTRVSERTLFYQDGATDPMTGNESRLREKHPVRVAQLGAHVERAGGVRRAALEASVGMLAQQLRTRTTRYEPGPPSQGNIVRVHHRNTYLDPALSAGVAVGPATGRWAALRLGMRSTHVWRSPDLANAYRFSTIDAYNATERRWQWQPELSLGWRVGSSRR